MSGRWEPDGPVTIDVVVCPVTCDLCGADMTYATITAGDERLCVLVCPCGQIGHETVQVRETITARVCAPRGAPGRRGMSGTVVAGVGWFEKRPLTRKAP